MRVRAVLLRLFGVLAIIAGVFFASFFLAIAMRQSGVDNAAAAASNDHTPTPSSALSKPVVSGDALAVPTTDVPVLTTPTVPLVTIALGPDQPPLDIDPVFDAIRQRLRSELRVALRLPATLGDDAALWQPTISSIDANGYVVHVGSDADCNGASACRVSTFTARKSVRLSPTLGTGTRVPLPNGLTGVFSDSTCGTGCNNGFITWIEDGVRYSVGSRVASGPAVLDLAWRSIDRSLPTPSGPEVCGPGAPKHDGRVSRTISTEVDESRSLHWVVVCSEDGTDIEIIDAPGTVRWVDLDGVGDHEVIVDHDDGTSTMFTIDANRPRPVIDIATGRRLVAADLGCADLDGNGRVETYDRAASDELRFVNQTAVRRVERGELSESSIGDC